MYRQTKKWLPLLSLLLIFSGINSAQASSDDTVMGRYMTVDNKPTQAQVDLLSQVIQVRFPQNIQTIGDAMRYILRLSGYDLAPAAQQSTAFKNTLAKPLPAVDRNFGPMSLKDALNTLSGPAFYSIQDPLNRLVNFRVRSQFARFENSSSESED